MNYRDWSYPHGSPKCGGFLGIGGSSAKTDRGNQLAATQGEWSIFNNGLGFGIPAQQQGTSTLTGALQPAGQAQDYFSKLLTAGRSDTAQRSAPAINAELAGADAQRTQAGQFGTGRSGGTAAVNANAGAQTTANVDNTINQNLVTGQQQGAQGLLSSSQTEAGIGSNFLSNALQLLGLGANADTNILNNATQSRPISMQAGQQAASQLGGFLGSIATKFGPQILNGLGLGGGTPPTSGPYSGSGIEGWGG